jgi:RNA polymerase sigma-70 factor (ECF subfamily)
MDTLAQLSPSVPMEPAEAKALFLRFAEHGDESALEQLLGACADQAYSQARHLLGDAADAEDAVQEALLRLIATAARYDGRVPFAAWLGRLVHDAALQLARSRRRRQRRERDFLGGPPPPASSEAELHAEAVRALVASLPERYRQVVDLHYFAGLSPADTAIALGLSAGTLRVRLHRAHHRLAQAVQARGGIDALQVAVILAGTPPLRAAARPDLSRILARARSATAGATSGGGGLFAVSGAAAFTLMVAVGVAAVCPAPPSTEVAQVAAPAAVAGTWQEPARTLLTRIDPDAGLRWGIDVDTLRQQLAHTPLLGLLADPQAQPAIARCRHTLQRLQDLEDGPPLIALLQDLHGLVGGMAADQQQNSPLNLWANGSDRLATAWGRFVDSLARDGTPSLHNATFQGVTTSSGLVGLSDGLLTLAASDAELEASARRSVHAVVPPEHSAHPLWWECELSQSLRREGALVALAGLPVHATMSQLLHHPPLITGWADTRNTDWQGGIAVQHCALGLRPVEARLVSALPADALATVVLGLDMPTWRAALAPSEHWKAGDQLSAWCQQCCGVPLSTLLSLLGGDAALIVEQDVGLPRPTLILSLARGADPGPMLNHLAQALPAATGDVARSWLITTPVGGWEITVADGYLLVGGVGDERRWRERLRLAPAVAPASSAGPAVLVAIDVPRLVRSWLPVLIDFVPTTPLYIEDAIQYPLGEAAIKAECARHTQLTISWATYPSGIVEQRAALVAATAVYEAPLGPQQWRWVSVLRTACGFFLEKGTFATRDGTSVSYVPEPWNPGPSQDLPEVMRAVNGMQRITGGDPAQLPAVALPDMPSVDRRSIPDPRVIAAHLVPYRLQVEETVDGCQGEESGLPLAALALAAVCAWEQATLVERLQPLYAAIDRVQEPRIRAGHAAALVLLERWRALVDRLPSGHVPNGPAALIAQAGDDRAQLAPICGGRIPASLADLDHIGRWCPAAAANQLLPLWIVPLEPGWWAYLTVDPQRAVQVTCDPGILIQGASSGAPIPGQIQVQYRETLPAPSSPPSQPARPGVAPVQRQPAAGF